MFDNQIIYCERYFITNYSNKKRTIKNSTKKNPIRLMKGKVLSLLE